MLAVPFFSTYCNCKKVFLINYCYIMTRPTILNQFFLKSEFFGLTTLALHARKRLLLKRMLLKKMQEAEDSSDESYTDSVEEISDSEDSENEKDGGLNKRRNPLKKVFKRRNQNVEIDLTETVSVSVPLPMPKNVPSAEDTYKKLLGSDDSDDSYEIIDQPVNKPLNLPPPKL